MRYNVEQTNQDYNTDSEIVYLILLAVTSSYVPPLPNSGHLFSIAVTSSYVPPLPNSGHLFSIAVTSRCNPCWTRTLAKITYETAIATEINKSAHVEHNRPTLYLPHSPLRQAAKSRSTVLRANPNWQSSTIHAVASTYIFGTHVMQQTIFQYFMPTDHVGMKYWNCLLYTSPSPRD